MVVALLTGRRSDRAERPGDRAALGTGALAGLLLLSCAWAVFLLTEAT